MAYLNVWDAWKGAGEGRPSWAHRHCLNHKTLLRVADIRSQLLAHVRYKPSQAPEVNLAPEPFLGPKSAMLCRKLASYVGLV